MFERKIARDRTRLFVSSDPVEPFDLLGAREIACSDANGLLPSPRSAHVFPYAPAKQEQDDDADSDDSNLDHVRD